MTRLAVQPRAGRANGKAHTSLRLAAIDIGSNSVHLAIAQADADGGMTTLWRAKQMVELGRLSFPNGRLPRVAMDRTIQALGQFKQVMQYRQIDRVVAVATSAIREADNGGDLIERIKRELKIAVRVVSAREEARLIYVGVRQVVPMRNRPHLILDIGGGSVEFIVGDERQPLLLESRKLGAARMTARFIKSDPISSTELSALRKHYDRELTPVCEQILRLEPVRAIGTSGTLENIAAMCAADSEGESDDDGAAIGRAALERLVRRLLTSNSDERARVPGLDPKRRDQIMAGMLLTEEIMRNLRLKRIHLCGSALREGLLVDYLSRHMPELLIRREVPDPRRRSVLDLARRCGWHKTHSQHVTFLCMNLFDELRSLHEMGDAERELIEYAALLHDIGWHIAGKRHHKHAMYLILNGDLKDFSQEEIRVIANIARYHRKSPPSPRHEAYASLSPRAGRIVDVGSALLRVADGLDRSHGGVVSGLRCDVGKSKIRCMLMSRADPQLELWGAQRKAGWLEKLFDREISFSLGER